MTDLQLQVSFLAAQSPGQEFKSCLGDRLTKALLVWRPTGSRIIKSVILGSTGEESLRILQSSRILRDSFRMTGEVKE
jgi:hypothetical protein